MNDKFLSMLGICNKAGKLVTGKDKTIETINKNKAKLVMLASDLSENTAKEVESAVQNKNVKLKRLSQSMHDIGLILGKVSGIICITDGGIARKIEILLD